MTRTLLIEIRRSPFLWLVVPASLLSLVILFREVESWQNVWPEASVRVIAAATQLPAVAIAAVAAWSAQRIHRASASQLVQTSTRPGWQITIVHLSVSLGYALIPLAVAALASYLIVHDKAAPGGLWLSYMLLGIAAVVTVVGLGHSIGSAISNRLAAPLAGFASFFPLFIVSILVPFFGEANKAVSPVALAARLLLAGACVALALAFGPVSSPRRSYGGRITACVAVAVSVLFLLVAGPIQQPRQPVLASACQRVAATDVCLWPENAARLTEATNATKNVIGLTQRVIRFPQVVADEGLVAESGGSVLQIPVVAGATYESYRSLLIFQLTWQILADCGPSETEAHGRPRMQARAKLDTWLSSAALGRMQDQEWDSVSLTEAGRNEVRQTLGLPQAAQEEWARKQIAVMGRCNA
ncbi:hypothetical protein Aple_041340 [Acrocarpospora pleiomorpha]|uniref:Uncharacterized protein n=1 Tax=Acrocarpospora pleiomorpha TaxID=90975 RepID=A0A5M3XS52_9ACTN|nr:hypothetical protein [Acrocarpospora pleiomorpha]GES21238.1 hypothetical protein Aple_041340 [Acrocarpospora pleiomorpha]